MSEPIGAVAPSPEEAPCTLCGAERRTRLLAVSDAVWGRPGEFSLSRCEACGSAYLSPRPPRDAIGFYYRDLYRGDGLKFEEQLQYSGIASVLNGRRLADLFRRRRPKPGERHLDVGCGVGALVVRIARATGATAAGVDFDPNAVETLARRGEKLPVEGYEGTLAQQSFAEGSFATCSMIHFLEHSYDPKAELALAHRLLADGGAIVVEVPSDDSLARRVFGRYWFPHLAPQHLTLFSKASLVRSLEGAGFRDVRVKDAFAPLVWISSFVLAWHHTLGGKSRWARNFFARLFTLVFALVFVLPMFVLDVVLALLLPLAGRGDHIRATGVKGQPR
jgi:ubiquinone/menaquinone biosynthesis C-methylase UbiE